jgi:HlyD family secretion protein
LFSPAIEVTLTTVSWTSPSQSNAVLTASGYVVAQRKAAVASKGTGRLVYLGVVEGDRVKKNQIIARLEDSDVRASLEQAKANLRLNEADLKDAQQSLHARNHCWIKALRINPNMTALTLVSSVFLPASK